MVNWNWITLIGLIIAIIAWVRAEILGKESSSKLKKHLSILKDHSSMLEKQSSMLKEIYELQKELNPGVKEELRRYLPEREASTLTSAVSGNIAGNLIVNNGNINFQIMEGLTDTILGPLISNQSEKKILDENLIKLAIEAFKAYNSKK